MEDPMDRTGRFDPLVAAEIKSVWRHACIGAGLTRPVDGSIAGTNFHAPKVERVDLESVPPRLLVRLLPGMLSDEVRVAARAIAPSLNAAMLRVQDGPYGWVWVTLLAADPLLGTVPRPVPIRSVLEPVLIGRGEDGDLITWDLPGSAHAIIQGTTGGGKSIATYNLLAQLVDAPDVAVTGSDITALTLAPWADRVPAGTPRPALGTSHANSHLAVVEKLCKLMDARIQAMPRGRDSVEIAPDCPVIVCVLEEVPGLYRFVKTADPKLYDRLRAAIGRLLGEGRKAGIRLLMIAQRADADILGGYERGQASHKLSFRVDTMDAVRMLHPDATPELAAEHASAPAGVALVSLPGRSLLRLKSPYVPFHDYVDLVAPEAAA